MTLAITRPEFTGRFRGRRSQSRSEGVPASGLQRVLGNFARLAGGKAVAGIVSAVYLVLITRSLGASGYGVLILMNAYVVLIGTIFAYCVFHGVVRYGAIALEEGDPALFARIVRFMGVVELVLGVVAIAAAAIIAPLVGPKLGWSAETVRFAVPYSLAIVAQIRATPQGVLQVAQRFDLISAHQVVMPLARLLGAGVVFLSHGGLMDYLAVWLGASVVEGAAMWILAWSTWRKLAQGQPVLGEWRSVPEEIGGFRRFITMTKIESTLREVAPKLAPLTVGWVLGPAAAGAFALALRGTNLLEKPAGLLTRAIYPVLASQNARNEGAPLWQTVWRSTFLALATAAPIVLLLALFGPHLLPFIGGKSFQTGGLLLILIALSRVASLAASPLTSGLTALGRPGRSMWISVLVNLGLYPLMPVLMWKFGVAGAGWHAALTAGLGVAALAYFFNRDGRIKKADPVMEARPLNSAMAQQAYG